MPQSDNFLQREDREEKMFEMYISVQHFLSLTCPVVLKLHLYPKVYRFLNLKLQDLRQQEPLHLKPQ